MSELEDSIAQLSNKQYDQFKSSVSDMLMDRLKGRIDNEKYAVSQSIFNDQDEQEAQAELDQDYQPEVEESEQQEETSHEEV
jgi:hypothetical protein